MEAVFPLNGPQNRVRNSASYLGPTIWEIPRGAPSCAQGRYAWTSGGRMDRVLSQLPSCVPKDLAK